MKEKLKKLFVGNSGSSLLFQFKGIIQYIPLIVCGGFFVLTIFIFAFGPLDWDVDNPFTLYGFLLLCCIALTSGYLLAVKKGKTGSQKIKMDTNKILIVGAITFLALYIPTLLTTTGKWYPDIVTGLMDSGTAYRMTAYYSNHSSHLVMYIRMLLSPLLILVTPITFLFMPKLSTAGKIMGVITIILSFMLGISQGINKSCADVTAQIVLVLMILFFSNNHKGSKLIYRIKITGLIVLVCFSFLAYNAIIMRNRISTDISDKTTEEIADVVLNEGQSGDSKKPDLTQKELDKSVEVYSTFGSAVIRKNNGLMRIVPDRLDSSVLYIFSYVSHGYKGLSIAMDQDFTSSYGLGFSDFFRRNITKLSSNPEMEEEIYERTYMDKTSQMNWQTGFVWSTFFVYPASDISFPATIILIFFIGYLFALSWKDALITENPFAVVVFSGFCMMIFYFSANNQMFQSGENFIGFSVMLLLWFISRFILRKKSISTLS